MASTAINIKNYRTEIPGKLSPDAREFIFPDVITRNSHGKPSTWTIRCRIFNKNTPGDFLAITDDMLDNKPLNSDLHGWIKVDSGLVSGKTRDTVPTIVDSGKNLGKANATNVFCQTLRDALGKYNKQAKKRNLEGLDIVQEKPESDSDEEETEHKVKPLDRYPPMLAQPLQKQKTPLIFTDGVWVQIKYDGLRGVTYQGSSGKIITYSRSLHDYPGLDYIHEDLAPVFKYYTTGARNIYIDGELYNHDLPLQDINSLARAEKSTIDAKLRYVIYDVFEPARPEMTFDERLKTLNEIRDTFKFANCEVAPTWRVTSMDEINKHFKDFLAEKYEGAMIRLDRPYVYSWNARHSNVLLKLKPSFDAEFKCIGYTTKGKGKSAGAIMFICETDAGKKFNVTPALELTERYSLPTKMAAVEQNGKTYFENNYLGRPLIVTYDDMSRDGVPQRARTKGQIRTWE